MKTKPHTIVFLVSFPLCAIAEELPYEVKRLQVQRNSAIRKIDTTYIKQLEKIKSKYLRASKLDDANLVNDLILEARSSQKDFDPIELVVGTWQAKNGKYTIKDKEGNGQYKGEQGTLNFKVTYDKESKKYRFQGGHWADTVELTGSRTMVLHSGLYGALDLRKIR